MHLIKNSIIIDSMHPSNNDKHISEVWTPHDAKHPRNIGKYTRSHLSIFLLSIVDLIFLFKKNIQATPSECKFLMLGFKQV
jgi:hypothetical protein